VLPQSERAFWIASAVVFVVAGTLCYALAHRHEPGHRSPLPAHIKVPIIFAVVAFVVVAKKWLGSYVTTFPMVGVVAAYEARHSLWTVGRQMPFLICVIIPMLITCRVLQLFCGWSLGWSLVAGWVVFLAILIPAQRWRWRKESVPALED